MEITWKAFVTDKETGKKSFIESNYLENEKQSFIRDLRANGYSVIRVEPKVIYDFVLNNTNCYKWDFEKARKMYKKKIPLTWANFRNFE